MNCLVLSVLLAWGLLQLDMIEGGRVISVSKNNKTAVNTSLCWGEILPCNNLTVAFEGAYLYNDTTLRFDSLYSPYQLDASPFTTFENIHSLRLESYGTNQVVIIQCSNGAGLSFFSVSNISIVNISFVGCGAQHISTSINSSSDADLFLRYSVALYFINCTDVIMGRVNVSQSIGVAIQFYATRGINSITSCNLVDNNSPEGINGVSGGLYIEYPHCLPDSSSNSCLPLENPVNNSRFTIKDCLFSNNSASIGTVVKPNHVSKTATRIQFGSGGGILVSYNGSSNSNEVLIVDCIFTSNSATLRGGGVYVDFKSDSSANTITMVNSSIDNCTAFSGGAIEVFYYNFDSINFTNNSVSISSTNFTNNTAKFWGGAISLYITRRTTPANQFHLTSCIFESNTGSYGSAVSFSLWLSSSSGADNQLVPIVDSCRFIDNQDTKAMGSQELAQFGALYLYYLSVSFLNKVEFRSNYGSGVVAVSAEIKFFEDTESLFINNSAIHGAGISLLGNSIMTLFRNTSYLFLNNSASLFGGAIYSSSVGEHTAMSQNCFMQYENPYVSPRDWAVRFTFINNTVDGTNKTENIAGNGNKLNSIYAQSILPCLGVTAHQESSIDLATKREVFCWNKTMWQYSSPECWREIQTAVAELVVPPKLVVKPGVDASMDISAYDDLSNNVTDYLVLFAQSTTPDITIDRRYHYISSNTIKLHPNENYTINSVYSIHLQTLPSRVLETQLNVTFAKCTEGLELKDGVCTFIGTYGDYLRLNKTSGLAEVFRDYWFGVRKDNTTKIVAYCQFCNGFSSINPYIGGYIPLNFTSNENDACTVGRRKGFLCNECEDNHSISIFSTDQQCKNTSSLYNGLVWTAYVGSHILYYILLAVFIMVTNISFTAAPLNSAIIFAQMVSTVVDLNAGGIINLPGLKTTVKVYKSLYDLFNLNLFHVLFHHLTTSLPLPVAKIFLGFLPLLTLIAVSIIWAVISCCLCFDGNCFFRYKERHPNSWIVKKCTMFTVTERMKNMLGSFLLLSSTSLLIILFQVINPTFLRSSDGAIIGSVFFLDPGTDYSLGHFYFWLPIILIVVFVIPLIFFICCCRYRDNNAKKNIIDHMLHPLQCHFKRCEPNNHCEKCIEQVEIPKDPGTAEEIEKKRLKEEFPCKFSCRCLRLPPCCNNLIFISFRDFHWVPAGFFLVRIGLILIYNFAWDFIIRSTMQLVFVATVAAFIAIYRPYKKEWINALDTVVFLDLALLIALSAYQYHLTEVIADMSIWVYVVQLILIFLPFIWIVFYIFIRLWAFCRRSCKKNVVENEAERLVRDDADGTQQ